MEIVIDTLPKFRKIHEDKLKEAYDKMKDINSKPAGEAVDLLKGLSEDLDAPIIEIDQAWVPTSLHRLKFLDYKNCDFIYKGGKMTENEFVNKYLKKCAGRNAILLFCDLFGFSKMIIY